ncbi:RNA methyltransferase substrate-binding domain-containing protein, partial [Vibrio cholerae]
MSNELIYGIHAVNAVLQRDPARFVEAYVLKGRQDDRLLPVLNELMRL